MRKRIIIIVALFAFVVEMAKAQMDVQFADYTSLKSYYNPAVSGTEGKLNVAGAYSMQMAGWRTSNHVPERRYANILPESSSWRRNKFLE